MMPMHYGTFPLGGEPMHEPLERLHTTAAERSLTENVTTPEEGQPGIF
jgi:L-ascorbate metabolism protein UlaG (beta-lactamase superfamily)